MTPEQLKAIREALERMEWINNDLSKRGPDTAAKECLKLAKSSLAILATIEGEGGKPVRDTVTDIYDPFAGGPMPQPAKVLTDLELVRDFLHSQKMLLTDEHGEPLSPIEDSEGAHYADICRKAIRYARDNGYLAPSQPAKAISMQDVLLACGELNKRERVAVQWVLDRMKRPATQPAKVLTDEVIDKLCNEYSHLYAREIRHVLERVRDFGYLAPAPPVAKVLTDDMQKLIAAFHAQPSPSKHGRVFDWPTAEFVMQHLAPAPPVDIERIMEIFRDHRANEYKIAVPRDRGYSEYVDSVLRSRLTNALTQKP